MKKHLWKLLVLLLVCIQIGTGGMYQGGNLEYLPGELLVVINEKPGSIEVKAAGVTTGDKQIDNINERFGIYSWDLISPKREGLISASLVGNEYLYKIKFPKDTSVEEVRDAFLSIPEVVTAEPNYLLRATGNIHQALITPNDPDFSTYQDYLNTVKAPSGWLINTGSPEIAIAIIDTGVDWNHPDLASNIWINNADPIDGIDNDGNGFVDDYRGWDFVSVDAEWVTPGEDAGPPDNNPDDFDGHGTFNAGLASAVTNNSYGIAGTSWYCKIMAVRAGYQDKSKKVGTFSISDLIGAIDYATDNGARIINLSLGASSEISTILTQHINAAYNAGVLLIAAAGNDGRSGSDYPASLDSVMSVGATLNDDKKTDYSNYGLNIDIMAPGGGSVPKLNGVYSTYPLGPHSETGAERTKGTNGFGRSSGTSHSTPIVSGAAALVFSANPNLTNAEVWQQLKNTADNIDALNPGFEGLLGAGRLNIYKALTEGQMSEIDLNYTLTSGWNLIAFPFTRVLSFAGLTTDLYHFNGSTFDIISYSKPHKIISGNGYWIYVVKTTSFTARGNLESADSTTIAIQEGWNQIGNPYNVEINWDSNHISFNGTSLSEAENQGLLVSTIYSYESSNFDFYPIYYGSDSIAPKSAYWLYSNTEGNLTIAP